MTDYFVFRNHLCIACECLSINLYEFIKNNNYRGVTLNLIKRYIRVTFTDIDIWLWLCIMNYVANNVSCNNDNRFTIQLLQSLCLLYTHGVIHCDLKPENILLKHPTKSTLKVIDFGSSCFETDRGNIHMSI